ncbi:hypothetical protein ACFYWS_20580 [Streptomyces sp. NPDC002795]|uniref:phage distal tail protein n=1 Tax=Streptomyces sp. NPDC002795 TaxID=3364665 RepID=UPI0036D0A745
MASLTDWQLDFAGVVIGSGTPYKVADIAGLMGTPEQRSQDMDLPTEDGAFPGVDLYSPRTVSIDVGVRTPGDPAAATDAVAALERAVDTPAIRKDAGDLAVLRVRWPGRNTVRRLFGRARMVETASLSQIRYGWVPLTLTFVATDPGWFEDVEQTLRLPLSLSSTELGFKAPITPPITTGVVDPELRSGWLTNGGDRPTWPTLTIQGPVVNPRIVCAQTGRALALNYAIKSGEKLVIETRPGTRWVLHDGRNASTALTSSSRLDLFQLPVGQSEITWTGSDYSNSTRLTVAWRDAYTAL